MRIMLDADDIARLYRAIADEEPYSDLLQRVYDLSGAEAGLRPPADEARLANACKPKAVKHG